MVALSNSVGACAVNVGIATDLAPKASRANAPFPIPSQIASQASSGRFVAFVLGGDGILHAAVVRNPGLYRRQIRDLTGSGFLVVAYGGDGAVNLEVLRARIEERITDLPFFSAPVEALRTARRIAYTEAVLRPQAAYVAKTLTKPWRRVRRAYVKVRYSFLG